MSAGGGPSTIWLVSRKKRRLGHRPGRLQEAKWGPRPRRLPGRSERPRGDQTSKPWSWASSLLALWETKCLWFKPCWTHSSQCDLGMAALRKLICPVSTFPPLYILIRAHLCFLNIQSSRHAWGSLPFFLLFIHLSSSLLINTWNIKSIQKVLLLFNALFCEGFKFSVL